MIQLGGIRLYTRDLAQIYHNDQNLLRDAFYVWVLFEDQKNREKCEAQTQHRTNGSLLYPVFRFGQAVQWARSFGKDFTTRH